MKILDRYISSSVAAAFASGVMVFMVLLCAMSLFKGFIQLVTKWHVDPSVALSITAYKIPGMLVYAFPMAVLLGILLVFARMSAESEMVAIRAAGISFMRVTLPVLVFSLLITGLTFLISNYFAPYASEKSAELERVAREKAKGEMITYSRTEEDTEKLQYTIVAGRIEVDGNNGIMREVTVTYFTDGVPTVFVYAPQATWDFAKGHWVMQGADWDILGQKARQMSLQTPPGSTAALDVAAFRLTESPFLLSHHSKDPDDMRSDDIRRQVAEMRANGENNPAKLGKLQTRLAQRYSMPFSCLIFALIGAPLGLRHHRTSSAVGFGISLLVIFAFYFVNVYVTSFGDSGAISPAVAAWAPNIIGTILGIILLRRANG